MDCAINAGQRQNHRNSDCGDRCSGYVDDGNTADIESDCISVTYSNARHPEIQNDSNSVRISCGLLLPGGSCFFLPACCSDRILHCCCKHDPVHSLFHSGKRERREMVFLKFGQRYGKWLLIAILALFFCVAPWKKIKKNCSSDNWERSNG